MPMYEYLCQECGERFEKLIRSSSQPPTITCPRCASDTVERAISTFATSSGQRGSTASASAANCGPVG